MYQNAAGETRCVGGSRNLNSSLTISSRPRNIIIKHDSPSIVLRPAGLILKQPNLTQEAWELQFFGLYCEWGHQGDLEN